MTICHEKLKYGSRHLAKTRGNAIVSPHARYTAATRTGPPGCGLGRCWRRAHARAVHSLTRTDKVNKCERMVIPCMRFLGKIGDGHRVDTAMTAAFAVPAMAASDSGTTAHFRHDPTVGLRRFTPQPLEHRVRRRQILTLRDKANTVVEPGIDSATKARLNEALKLKGIETTAGRRRARNRVPARRAGRHQRIQPRGRQVRRSS